MAQLLYSFEDNFSGTGSLNNYPHWSAESGQPGWTLHTGYIRNDDVGGTAISNRNISPANPEFPRVVEVEFSLPPDDTAAFSFTITIGSIWGIIVSREAGVGKFVNLELFTPPSASGFSTLVSTGQAHHVMRCVYDGFQNDAYLDDEHIVHFLDTSNSNTLPQIQLEADDLSGIKIYRITGAFYMPATFAIAAAPVLVFDNSGGDYDDTPIPLAWVDFSGTLKLCTADYIANEIQSINLITGVRTTEVTLGAGAPDVLSAIADHPLGLLVSGIGTFGNYLLDKSTGAILGGGQAFWPRAANHADFGGILYNTNTTRIEEATQCTIGHNDIVREYYTPALTNNGAIVVPFASYTPVGQGIAGNITASGAGSLLVDQAVANGTAISLTSFVSDGLSTIPGMTGQKAYGIARKSTGLINILGFTASGAGGTLTSYYRTDGVQTVGNGAKMLGESVTGTLTFPGGGTINASLAAMTLSAPSKVFCTGGTLIITTTGGYTFTRLGQIAALGSGVIIIDGGAPLTAFSSTLTQGGVRFTIAGTVSTDVGATQKTITAPEGGYVKKLTNGTVSGSANCIASIVGTVTFGSPVTLDLSVLNDGEGASDPTVLTSIKGIIIQDTSPEIATANKLHVGDSSGVVSDTLTSFFGSADGTHVINSGGALALSAPDDGYPVDFTHKSLILTAAAGTITYQIDIIGTKLNS